MQHGVLQTGCQKRRHGRKAISIRFAKVASEKSVVMEVVREHEWLRLGQFSCLSVIRALAPNVNARGREELKFHYRVSVCFS
jgi:hypothetical protein